MILEDLVTTPRQVTWVAPKLCRPPDWTVVWVDVAKLDASFSKDDGFYIGQDGKGGIGRHSRHGRDRYAEFGIWINEGHPVEMSEVSIGWKGQASFNNGRHRFAWMRDHGAKALPVVVPSENAEKIAHMWGTTLRQTTIV